MKFENSAGVQEAIMAGADVHHVLYNYGTAMYWAAGRGDTDTIQALLQAGADVNQCPPNYGHALVRAITNSKCAAVQALLRAGAEVNGCDSYGHTPLMLAAQQPDAAIVQALLQAGAQVNRFTPFRESKSALFYAAKEGNLAAVQMLLEGNKETFCRQDIWNAVSWAHADKYEEIRRIIFAYAKKQAYRDRY